MGASGWEYVTAYEGSVERSLEALHRQVFDEYYGHDDMYGCLDDLWAAEEFMGEEGTHSILDIQRVVRSTAVPTPLNVEDYGTLRPLTEERVLHHFGTVRPTPVRFAELLDHARTADRLPPDPEETLLDECRMRWTGVYVLPYADDQPEPTHLGIFGYSGD
ncbi:hypothetical protein BU52_12730 [Streptomyces toyocaensis]|uniref:Uncharacterized protein n=1 Tax=Streptomyces toyocaensis TaxID=55952 RepID=A0A081XSX2_STRTO|nr:hypothetical protein [Streptomyces toyocaensis]KES06645.1 hypothetical protein BU52_12730 [Streptomyces toyocaensis]